MYEEYVSLRLFLRFFLSPSAGADAFAADLVAVFLADEGSVDLAGAFPAVEAGAFPAVEAGLGAIERLNDAVSEGKKKNEQGNSRCVGWVVERFWSERRGSEG
jgi:hypothetical protein